MESENPNLGCKLVGREAKPMVGLVLGCFSWMGIGLKIRLEWRWTKIKIIRMRLDFYNGKHNTITIFGIFDLLNTSTTTCWHNGERNWSLNQTSH